MDFVVFCWVFVIAICALGAVFALVLLAQHLTTHKRDWGLVALFGLYVLAQLALSGCASVRDSRGVMLGLWDTEILVVNQTTEPLAVYVGSQKLTDADGLAPGGKLAVKAEAFGEISTTATITAISKTKSATFPFYASDYSKNYGSWVIKEGDLR